MADLWLLIYYFSALPFVFLFLYYARPEVEKRWSDWETLGWFPRQACTPALRTTFPTKLDYNSHEPPSAPGKRKLTASCLAKSLLAQDRNVNVGLAGWVVFWVLQKRDGRMDRELDVSLFPAPFSYLDLSRKVPVYGSGTCVCVLCFLELLAETRHRRSCYLNSILRGSLDCGVKPLLPR